MSWIEERNKRLKENHNIKRKPHQSYILMYEDIALVGILINFKKKTK